jgi:amino acid adenylation domain-containing protein
MLRAELVVLNEIENVLVVTLHHIASDGWSSSIIVKELVELYKAFEEGGPVLTPLKIQYADYAIWQRNYLQGEVLEKMLAYWKQQLQGVAALQLPTDYARPAVQSTKGATAGFVLDKAISDQLVLLSQQQGTTLFMTMLAVFKVLLYRYTGQQDICVGTPIAGRHQQELESLVGFFINTIALRSALQDDASFTALLQQVKTTTLEAYDHQDMPFEKIVDAVSRERDMSRSPLFQVMFIMQNIPAVPDFKLGDVSLVKQPLKNTSAKFDITFYVAESPDGLQGIMEYCTDLFHEATIERMLGHFKELLNAVVISPHQKIGALPMLNNNEEQEILVQFNDTAKTLPVEKTVIGLFETQVEKTPAAIALVFEDREMSYEELNQLANNLAHELRHRGAKPGMLVPVCIERSLEMVIAILGVLKSGAAYVPIDADYPEERIRFMLDDTAATLIITDKKFAATFESGENLQVIIADSYGHSVKWPGVNLSNDVDPDPLIAVIYTSGSSGRPKGVKLGNAGLVNRMYWMWDAYPFGPNEKCALKTSIGFVDHMWELFGPLAKGITAVLFKKEELLDLDSLLNKLSIHKITRWVLVPSLLRTLLEKMAIDHITLDNLQYWTCSGEAIPANLVKDFYALFPAASHRLLNIYGSSEVTADVTCYDTSIDFVQSTDNVKNHGKVPIGKPIANTQVYIVDNAGRLVAKGVTGEILIGGVQLAKGYLNLPGLTAEKFIQNPFNREEGAVLFRTGDMGCWLPDGNISYLGRKDDQLKIRGNRVEPGEIEGLLKQSGLVNNAVIVAKDDHHGDKRLIGYVVAEGAFNKEAAQTYLKKRLPDYMVPAAWMVLESLPLTHNGKLDKKALPEPGTVELTGASYLAPRNELECRLAEIWKEILHVEQVGVYDNFFELGGHSLLAIRLVSAIRRKLELELIINDIFIYPTIATFADNIIEKVKNPSMPIVNIKYLVSIKSGGNKIPLYIVCGAGGTALRFKKFSDMLDTDQPVFVLQPPIDSNTKDFPASFEEIARVFIEEILIQNPAGPFALSGHCLGGFIAFEMARQLEAMGKKVHLLAMFDSIIRESEKYELPSIGNLFRSGYLAKKYFERILLKFDFETFLLKNHTRHAIKYKVNAIARLFTKMRWKKAQPKQFEFAGLEVFGESSKIYISASKNYKLVPYPGDVVLFYAREHYYFMDRSINVEFRKLDLDETTKNNWKEFAVAVKVHDVAGEHSTIFDPVHGDQFARLLQQHLNEGALQYQSQV